MKDAANIWGYASDFCCILLFLRRIPRVNILWRRGPGLEGHGWFSVYGLGLVLQLRILEVNGAKLQYQPQPALFYFGFFKTFSHVFLQNLYHWCRFFCGCITDFTADFNCENILKLSLQAQCFSLADFGNQVTLSIWMNVNLYLFYEELNKSFFFNVSGPKKRPFQCCPSTRNLSALVDFFLFL